MINLDRLPGDDSFIKPSNAHYRIADIEVLTNNKVPLSRLSTAKQGQKFKCPACGGDSLDLYIDYRCQKMFCNARIIKYKTYNPDHVEHSEEMHDLYEDYVKRFYNKVKEKTLGLEKNKRAFNN